MSLNTRNHSPCSMVQNQMSLWEKVHIMNVGCGLWLTCGLVVVLNFIIGGHCVCTIHRKVSDILFQHKELWYHKGQTQPSEVHWGNSNWWALNTVSFVFVVHSLTISQCLKWSFITRLHGPMQTGFLHNAFLRRNFNLQIGMFQEVNKIDAYTQTKQDPQFLLEGTKKRLGVWYLFPNFFCLDWYICSAIFNTFDHHFNFQIA